MSSSLSPDRRLSILAAISGLYDVIVGAFLFLAPNAMASWFGVLPPSPPIFVTLDAMFLVSVGVGYSLPYRDPDRWRAYLWIMGPLLKGGGALIFVLDYLFRGSPPSFLLFAATDGTLAAVTLWALLAVPGRRPASAGTAGRPLQ